jgi:hypothetical protein
MKISRIAIPVMVTALVATAPAAASAAEFEGTVLSVNREKRTFRLDDSERGIKRIKVTRNTRFERIDGFSALRAGMRNVEVVAKRRDGRWVAVEVERSGGGGEHGGDDDYRLWRGSVHIWRNGPVTHRARRAGSISRSRISRRR